MTVYALSASSIINEARDLHPGFDPRQVPDPVALRALSRLVRKLAGRVTLEAEDALIEQVTVSGAEVLAVLEGDPTADPPVEAGSGYLLPDHLYLSRSIHAVMEGESRRHPVTLVNYHQRYTRGGWGFPAVSLYGGRLYPVDCRRISGNASSTHGWEELAQLELMLVPVPGDLTQLTDAVGLPPVCREALVLGLALFMAGRTPGALAELPMLRADAEGAQVEAVAALVGLDSGVWEVARGGAE